ncbi:MAG: ABC transporter substrate-binding protein [Phycisphaeraceae bacterium]|nr:ABC transporter substrate-binding protein [Phycisphaeraceae bacterium]
MKTHPFSPDWGTWWVFALLVAVAATALVGLTEWWPRATPSRTPAPDATQPGDAPASTPAPVPADLFPFTISTLDGEVTIPARPKRIIAQTLMATEVLLGLGAQDQILGFHRIALDLRYSKCVAEAQTIKDRAMDSAEAIVAAGPDLVFMASYSTGDVVEQVRQGTHAPIVRLGDHNTIEDVKHNIRLIGRVAGMSAQADAMVKRMEARIAAAVAKIPADATSPGVVTFSLGEYTAGAGTLFDDVVHTVKAHNVAAEHGIQWFGRISAEQVVAWRPDVIVSGAETGSVEAVRAKLYAMESLRDTPAVRHRRVLVIPNPVYTAASQHLATLVETMVDGLYGPADADDPASGQPSP